MTAADIVTRLLEKGLIDNEEAVILLMGSDDHIVHYNFPYWIDYNDNPFKFDNTTFA